MKTDYTKATASFVQADVGPPIDPEVIKSLHIFGANFFPSDKGKPLTTVDCNAGSSTHGRQIQYVITDVLDSNRVMIRRSKWYDRVWFWVRQIFLP